MEYIILFIMKQKRRYKNFENIGYRSMNGRYIGIGPKKSHAVELYIAVMLTRIINIVTHRIQRTTRFRLSIH